MDLAFRADVPLSPVVISSSWSDRVAPQVVPNRSFAVREARRGETIQRVIRVQDPLEKREPMVLRIDRLPRPLKVQGSVAIYGSLLLLGAFGLALIRGRARHG
jgi:hypothetical protein